MYWAEEEIIAMLAGKLARTSIDSLLPLEPGSTLILEFYMEPAPLFGNDKMYVRMYIND